MSTLRFPAAPAPRVTGGPVSAGTRPQQSVVHGPSSRVHGQTRLLWTIDYQPWTFLLLTFWAAGCSIIPARYQPSVFNLQQAPEPYSKDADLRDDGYRDLAGVIHVHTRYSDGTGSFEEIARIANAQKLDFLVVTDHNTLKPLRDGKQGWYGQTLVLAGTEVSTSAGHYLALNVKEEINRSHRTPQQIIDQVKSQGGLGFIAHPYGKRRWTDWSVTGFDGIEVYNAWQDTLDENRLRIALWTLAVPQDPLYYSLLDRPYDPLSSFDAMIRRHGRLTAIGGPDAHQYTFAGMTFAPYGVLFRFARTHLLVPDAPLTPEMLYDALRAGHAYVGFELLTETRGFTWTVTDSNAIIGIMGDTVAFRPNLALHAATPAIGQMKLFKDGQPVAEQTGTEWRVPVDAPGVYRIEVYRHAKPWILSNPIIIE